MLSKNKIKEIAKYSLKKHRDEDGVFIAEGPKLVNELLSKYPCKILICTDNEFEKNNANSYESILCTEDELKRISLLKSPQSVFAIFEKPEHIFNQSDIDQKLCLALDDIQDPGNMGTILRIADWFGIEYIFCSKHCADIYNPKTIQATMGAIARVKVFQVDLAEFLKEQKRHTSIYGTFLDGENLYDKSLSQTGIIVMGNEGNGISAEVGKHINERLFIPNFPQNRESSESLNVAVATSIICAEFRRQAL